MTLVLLHEQDPTKGACPFRQFFQQTPKELLQRWKIYDTIAVPLQSHGLRIISFRCTFRNMGATGEVGTGNFWAELCRMQQYSKFDTRSLPTRLGLPRLLRWVRHRRERRSNTNVMISASAVETEESVAATSTTSV
jgi:hypothetical protein